MNRYLLLLVVLLAACAPSRELTGTQARLHPDQLAWLAAGIERDLAAAPVPPGARTQPGRLIVRADGEVIAGRPLMQAAMRGIAAAGGTALEEGAGEADLIVLGEINVQAQQVERSAVTRYVCEMRLVRAADRSVSWRQTYLITNTHAQQRWR